MTPDEEIAALLATLAKAKEQIAVLGHANDVLRAKLNEHVGAITTLEIEIGRITQFAAGYAPGRPRG